MSDKRVTMRCKLCNCNDRLVNSHIIPAAFHRDLSDDFPSAFVLDPTTPTRKRRSPAGEYDRIVCSRCEQRFQIWDQYAAEVFILQRESFQMRTADDGFTWFVRHEYDYAKLKLFFVSLLWRAHASRRPFFDQVSIPDNLEAQARSFLIEGNPGSVDDFAVILSRFVPPALFMMSPAHWYPPCRTKVRFMRIYVGKEWIAQIKVDDQSTPSELIDSCLSQGKPAIAITRELKSSAEYQHAIGQANTRRWSGSAGYRRDDIE